MRTTLCVLLAVTLSGGCSMAARPSADLVIRGGTVWTGVPGAPRAEAVAVRDGVIQAVGTVAEVDRHVGSDTRTLDLTGGMLLPGFSDDHTHFMSGGFQLGSVDLRDASTPAEFARRLGEFSRGLPAGRWITGGDWDHELFPGAELPRKEWVDSLTGDRPIFVNRLDGHMALANSAALRLAGITRETQTPAGGEIVRDAAGEPTGVLKDEAMALVFRVIPAASAAEREEAFRRAQDHALSRGVTMVHDMGAWPDLDLYREMHRRGDLKLRIYSLVPLDSWERLKDDVARNGTGDDRLRWGGLKGFVDGSLGSTTAWFHEPYVDAPTTSGFTVTDTAALGRWITGADAAGLHVVVHAIGDRANDWLLDSFENAARRNGARDRRFRIEHAQHLSRAAIGRFSQLGVLPSMQPYHAIDDGRWAEKRIGAERAKGTYAFRSLVDAGAGLMFGSDWTVAPMDPLLGIYAAVTRRTTDGANPNGWVPEQKITVEEALRAYTRANAYGAFMEDRIGTIEVGKRADLVILSEDLLKIDATLIPEVRVEHTIVDGEVVYSRVGS